MFVIATAAIASVAGFSGTLGDVIANQASYHSSGVLGAAICVAALALAVDGAFSLLQRGADAAGPAYRGDATACATRRAGDRGPRTGGGWIACPVR